MKKALLFVVMVLCLAGTLALAEGMAKSTDDKTMMEKPAATSTEVAVTDETAKAEKAVTDGAVKDESLPAAKDVEKEKVDTTAQ